MDNESSAGLSDDLGSDHEEGGDDNNGDNSTSSAQLATQNSNNDDSDDDDQQVLMWLYIALIWCIVQYSNTCPILLIDYRHEEQWSGNSMTDVVVRFWIKRRPKLIHNYSLVGYILSPNLTIMAHAIDNKTIKHDQAAEQLITKLILNPTLVGTKRRIKRAKLIDIFMEEYGEFTNKRGMFARDNIWIMASNENAKA
jgi:hypothetical protein